MQALHLDPNFQPLSIPTLQFEAFTFSGGEPHIKIHSELSDSEAVTITHRVRSFNDIGFILLAVDALRRAGVKELHLIVPYFPAARQDRLMVPGEPLSVKVYADLINGLGFDSVRIFDPHSDVTPALVNNSISINNHAFIDKVIQEIGNDIVFVSPDGGALKKIYKVASHVGKVEVVECSKQRDVHTGKLSGFHVYSEDLRGKNCLIIDDICDGGGTFVGVAEALKRKNAGNLYLAVSHGLFTKGFDILTPHFNRIFTTNSCRDLEDACLTQFGLNDDLLKGINK